MDQLGKNIISLCRVREWSLAELAKKARVPKATVFGWTTGKNPKLSQLKAVAQSLQVGIHELCFGVPDPYQRLGEETLKELFSGDIRVTVHRIDRMR